MGRVILYILERCPWLEVAVRRFLWKFPAIKQFISKYHHLRKGREKQLKKDPAIWENIKRRICEYHIEKGDILLVHSSMDGLAKTGASAKEVIDFLLELLGEGGTLVFAAYPKCNSYQGNEEILYYDPKRTLSWTGMLPNVFCKYKGVIRSEFPYNTLAAKGKYAAEMMRDNLMDDVSMAGHSPWQFCIEHHAKILYLGVSAALSCTMMNYPEDALGEDWYVKDWYGVQKYAIKQGNKVILKTIRERDSGWYRFYAMFYSEYWMIKNQFLIRDEIEDVYVGFTENMYGLAQELLNLGRQGKSVYRIPKKYRKKI
ncbi:MAG: AAC(3) family N-acetyltransferase [Roseburia sp.]|nr:AAC(3) family N-acetyltransferase [Roseburia sp.]